MGGHSPQFENNCLSEHTITGSPNNALITLLFQQQKENLIITWWTSQTFMALKG